MKLAELHPVRSLYRLPREPFIREILIPSFRVAGALRCMFGFFSSDSLRELAPGLAEYLARSGKPIQLIISPLLGIDDIQALDQGISTPAEVFERRLEVLLGDAKITANALVLHTLSCFSYLLASNRLEIKIARVRNGLFHPKVWIFDSENDALVAHGSSNLTVHGLTRNVERIRIERSWINGEDAVIKNFKEDFTMLWRNLDPSADVITLPEAIKRKLLEEFRGDRPPTASTYEAVAEEPVIEEPISTLQQTLSIPSYLNYEAGPFRHQGDAVHSWEDAGRRGILSMATGSGKTITALIAATRLQQTHAPLFIVVSAPYKVLISQWEEEVRLFGAQPIPLTAMTNSAARINRLQRAKDALACGASTVEIAVMTEDMLSSPSFREYLDALPTSINTLLIADECHNLGAASFTANPPDRFAFRLGLSATPRRQYDPDGTQRLFAFFGEPVFEYSLEDAIGSCLVRYEYFLHPVELTDVEFQDWKDKSAALGRAGFGGGDCDPSDAGALANDIQRLLNARRAILEGAERKIPVLRKLIEQRSHPLKHTLIYTTDKRPSQMDEVNSMLQRSRVLFHQLTSEETSSREGAKEILRRFSSGDLQVLTCKKVLDEGVNIPEIVEAHLLASNTVERQWVQRRGRILRKCESIGKTIARLHDYIVVPPILDASSRSLLKGELRRAHEFARLAENAGDPGGPLEVISQLT